MRLHPVAVIVTGTVAVALFGGTLAGAGSTAASWRHDTGLEVGQVRLGTVQVDLAPGFDVEDLHAGRYIKVTPGDDYTAVTFRVTPRISTPGTAATLILSLPADWQVVGHPYLHPEVSVDGVPVPATGRFQHTVHLVPEGTVWVGGPGPVVTVRPGEDASVEVTLRLWRDQGGGTNFVVAPTELTATLQKVRDGRPVGTPATATTFVPGFYKGHAPVLEPAAGTPDTPGAPDVPDVPEVHDVPKNAPPVGGSSTDRPGALEAGTVDAEPVDEGGVERASDPRTAS